MDNPTFLIAISTKNRVADLLQTLTAIEDLLQDKSVRCVVYDDGSTDGTSAMVAQNFPQVTLLRNEKSKGYIYCRNYMLNNASSAYTISLDDDAHFLSANPLEKIEKHFTDNSACGVVAFRIFWGLEEPSHTHSDENPQQVSAFVGCGHAWRMSAWKDLPDYPEWFVFYGEEQFASFELFRKNWQVCYLPSVLVHHRANIKKRKNDPDYQRRTRMSLRSGWFLFFLFLPLSEIVKKFTYSLVWQIRSKILKGDWRATRGIIQALSDLILKTPKISAHRNALSKQQYQAYQQLEDTKIYWKPNE